MIYPALDLCMALAQISNIWLISAAIGLTLFAPKVMLFKPDI